MHRKHDNVNTMSQKPSASYCVQIVLSACVISLGYSAWGTANPPHGPKQAHASDSPVSYYAQTQPPIMNTQESSYIPGELIVHFSQGMAPHELELVAERKRQMNNSFLGKIRLSMLSIYHRLTTRIETNSTAQDHLDAIALVDAQFGALERSRMFDTEVESSSPSYLIRFPETVDLEKARLAYENLEEVSYVQYNFIYSLQQ